MEKEKQEIEQKERKAEDKSVRKEKEFSRSISVPGKEKEPLSRTYSAPSKSVTEVVRMSLNIACVHLFLTVKH